ncbi:Aste57867_13964 [Aphanomyces stellatus]|uniref:Aste57867_13964 protein n=1 Tax=Aphanomyces stellatus TaxID=120398 RepID=A0A485L1P6_9STRA|nr:hypothetical protein As57867_013913 [Aphanomyces stellatus]VFT90794.1 Aste57867_13964 [Aphanomyces stellatus]
MGQGASLVRSIASDVREIVASTNKDAYMKQYRAYKDATARLEEARLKNAALQQHLEMTKFEVYSQSEALRQQKEKLDFQIDEYANMYSIDSEFFDKHKRVAEHMKKHAAEKIKDSSTEAPKDDAKH